MTEGGYRGTYSPFFAFLSSVLFKTRDTRQFSLRFVPEQNSNARKAAMDSETSKWKPKEYATRQFGGEILECYEFLQIGFTALIT
jgi:hypothetical protein